MMCSIIRIEYSTQVYKSSEIFLTRARSKDCQTLEISLNESNDRNGLRQD